MYLCMCELPMSCCSRNISTGSKRQSGSDSLVWLFRGCLPIRTIIHPASFMTCFPFPGLPSNYQFSSTDLQNLKNFCLVAQLCLTICDSLNYGPPGSSVHGDFQARILDWVAVAFSRGSSQPWDRTQVSLSSGRFFTIWATREAQEYWSR